MRSTLPQVARPGHRVDRQLGYGICFLVIAVDSEHGIDLEAVKPGELEIEVAELQLGELEADMFEVPVGPGSGSIHQQAKGFHLCRRPVITEDDRQLLNSELTGGFKAQMPIDK